MLGHKPGGFRIPVTLLGWGILAFYRLLKQLFTEIPTAPPSPPIPLPPAFCTVSGVAMIWTLRTSISQIFREHACQFFRG
ncbi:hypothetical protein GYMLUDRAFT_946394 [Collybiopsis luxurians FD-317 M1]|uniref:Uncharacterized protein n=1 Tax=Collybiopsis luxurians FD-317 M1 TaxID=944289 RepID=A0A0D0BTC2_9AGAR|nr:hypothetical protein GYMLUDRAFT_946394 [Collybiopsis luxurians FD-317 M1]